MDISRHGCRRRILKILFFGHHSPELSCHAIGQSDGHKHARFPGKHARKPTAWTPEGFSHWLLARRSLRDPDTIAYYFAYARSGTTLAELAAAAGLRWTIEECFLRAKDDLGLDHCEAPSLHGWYRHISLVMAAASFLASLGADQRRSGFTYPNKTSPDNPAAQA